MTNETTHYSAVTHASCALASLHNKSIRVARGLDHPDLDPQYSTASQFYNKAYYLLFNDRTVPVAYSELDAFAALQLVSYWLLSGGTGHWPMLLNVACEWLASTGITTHENPRMAFLELNDVAKFTAKITMVSSLNNACFAWLLSPASALARFPHSPIPFFTDSSLLARTPV